MIKHNEDTATTYKYLFTHAYREKLEDVGHYVDITDDLIALLYEYYDPVTHIPNLPYFAVAPAFENSANISKFITIYNCNHALGRWFLATQLIDIDAHDKPYIIDSIFCYPLLEKLLTEPTTISDKLFIRNFLETTAPIDLFQGLPNFLALDIPDYFHEKFVKLVMDRDLLLVDVYANYNYFTYMLTSENVINSEDFQKYDKPKIGDRTLCTLNKALERLGSYTCGIFTDVFDWDNVYIAGGLVNKLLAVNDEITQATDIDLYVNYDVLEYVLKYFASNKTYYIENSGIITICIRDMPRIIQIHKCDNIYETLAGFDLDYCQFAYNGTKFLATAAACEARKTMVTNFKPNCEHLAETRIIKALQCGYDVIKNSNDLTWSILSTNFIRNLELGNAASEYLNEINKPTEKLITNIHLDDEEQQSADIQILKSTIFDIRNIGENKIYTDYQLLVDTLELNFLG